MNLVDGLVLAKDWANNNQGVVSVAIFVATIAFAWFTGIFSALRRKPKFRIALLPGPTFCCTFPTGQKRGAYDVHRTGIALYLDVANVGSAASSISRISVGYHWNLKPVSPAWVKNTVGWFWLHNQVTAIEDFRVNIGENVKLYPFLLQRGFLAGGPSETFLEAGRATNGVIYFEQPDSWGGCFPMARHGVVRMKISVRDIFGRCHVTRVRVPAVSLDYARRFSPSFGKTLAELRGEKLPFDSTTHDRVREGSQRRDTTMA